MTSSDKIAAIGAGSGMTRNTRIYRCKKLCDAVGGKYDGLCG